MSRCLPHVAIIGIRGYGSLRLATACKVSTLCEHNLSPGRKGERDFAVTAAATAVAAAAKRRGRAALVRGRDLLWGWKARGEVSLGEVSFPCRVARYDGGASFIKNKLSGEGSWREGRGRGGGGKVYRVPSRVYGPRAWRRACTAAYIQETPRTRRRRRGRDIGERRREEEEA